MSTEINLTFMWPCIVIKFLQKNQLDALISQIYSWNKTLHVSDSSSVHHQEFFTVHTAMVYVIQVCWELASRLSLLASCQQTCMTYTIAVCTVKNSWWWTEELSETCRVSFQNKFEKLVHLVGFIIRICNVARSHERKLHLQCTMRGTEGTGLPETHCSWTGPCSTKC